MKGGRASYADARKENQHHGYLSNKEENTRKDSRPIT